MSPAEFERYLHDHIPPSRALGVRVLALDGVVRLGAPLAPNLNHRHTAFGGSVSALGILAGWAAVHLALRARAPTPRLVIQTSETDFLHPVATAFEAVARVPDGGAWAEFEAAFERRGRARLALEAEILAEGRVCARHRGRYVALAAPDA